jgi:peptide/nickel transport system permease protein
VHSGFARFLFRRAASAALLIMLVSSAALVLADLAPPDDAFGTDRTILAAQRKSAGLDLPVGQQYVAWLSRSLRFDFGESLRFRRPVAALIRERAGHTALLGMSALLIATAIGIPLGVFTGSSRGGVLPAAARGLSLILLAVPSLVMSLILLLLAARTGWLPAGGLPDVPPGSGMLDAVMITLRYLFLPSVALALPIAAALERVQSRSMAEALADPSIIAALARGVSIRRVIWRHALRLSLKPVIAMYGITIGSVLSGSFVVEIVMSWQGLGDLMYQALQARDLYLVAGCAAAGSGCLAAGVLLSDIALTLVDPRIDESA